MHQQFRPIGACHAALGHGLEFVEQLGIGKVFRDEALQLRRAEGLEVGVEAQTHHFGVEAGDARQQHFELDPVGIGRVEQALDGTVDRGDDLRHGHGLELGPTLAAHMVSQRTELRHGELRHRDVNALPRVCHFTSSAFMPGR